MAFGSKVGSLKTLKKNLKKGSGDNTWIKYVPKDRSLNVRFLTEPDEWVQYREAYDTLKKRGYPVPDEGQPGYPQGDTRVSTLYLASAVNLEDDRVVPLALKKSLANQLVTRYDKYDTLMDRDYELFRAGEGLDTEYGLTPEPASKKNIAKYKPLDLLKVLEDAYNDVWGGGDKDDDEDEVDEDLPPSKPAKVTKAIKKTAVGKPKAEATLADLVKLADDGDAAAQQKLTDKAAELSFDADDYDTWQEVADVIDRGDAAEAEDDMKEDEAEEDLDRGDEVTLLTKGELADAGDDDAEEEVDAAAQAVGVVPDDYDTWTEVAWAVMEKTKDAGTEDDEEDTRQEIPDEETLNGMALGEVRAVARDIGITTMGKSKKALIAAILTDEEDEEDEDDEE